ncbi:MAG: hypothetical protein P0116_03700 [Candidatus Nitrosocosmicus sp.]|nr:hypothetical protein [Candidatus Nitrosocosmicus sp.]
MDEASNGVITWDGVDSTINLGGGGKTTTISADHEDTDHHFAGQPIIGTVTSLTPAQIRLELVWKYYPHVIRRLKNDNTRIKTTCKIPSRTISHFFESFFQIFIKFN